MFTLGFYLVPDFQLLDLTGPLAAFQMAGLAAGTPGYRCVYLSAAGGVVTSSVGLPIATQAAPQPLDALIAVGGFGAQRAADDPAVLEGLRSAARGVARYASVCTGAYLLAGAGLLDGRRATTHWRQSADFARRFPRVRLQADAIWVQDGPVWTSAGVTAGIDLALVWIELDYGREVAQTVARELVVYYRRPGGQSQFSQLEALGTQSERLARLVAAVRGRLSATWHLAALAEVACLSPRQLCRVVEAETGASPAKLVERLRVEAARSAVVHGRQSIESLAAAHGFADPERMRRAFVRWFGLSPQALRRQAHENRRDAAEETTAKNR